MDTTIQTNGNTWAAGLTNRLDWAMIGKLANIGRGKLEAVEAARAYGRSLVTLRRVGAL